jgi:uncharacterized protein YqgC (DUF456 family)
VKKILVVGILALAAWGALVGLVIGAEYLGRQISFGTILTPFAAYVVISTIWLVLIVRRSR